MDRLVIWNSKAQLEADVDQIITEADRKMFGKDVRDLVVQSIIYPAAFAQHPATFDTVAYAAVIEGVTEDMGLEKFDPNRINRLLQISVENGVIEMVENGRLQVPEEVYKKLRPILEEYK